MACRFCCVDASTLVVDAAKRMTEHRHTAVLVTAGSKLLGIFTERDVLTRVVTKGLNPSTTALQDVMTPNPDCATQDTSPQEALDRMHQGHYRHLPIVNGEGDAVGLIDIVAVTYDVILAEQGSDSSWLRWRFAHALGVFKNKKRSIFQDTSVADHVRDPGTHLLAETATALEAAGLMAARRISAVLVTSEGRLTGIVTERDIMSRVVSRGLDPALTALVSVMTSSPACVSPSTSPLVALEMMHKGHYRHLPVVSGTEIVGLLDILKLTQTGIAKGTAQTPAPKTPSAAATPMPATPSAGARAAPETPSLFARFSRALSRTQEETPKRPERTEVAAPAATPAAAAPAAAKQPRHFFKFKHGDANLRATISSASYSELLAALRERIGDKEVVVSVAYIDDDDDAIGLSSDVELADALHLAASRSWTVVRLVVKTAPAGAAVAAMVNEPAVAAEAPAAMVPVATKSPITSPKKIEDKAVLARERESKGNVLIQENRFEEALAAYVASYEVLPAFDAASGTAREVAMQHVRVLTKLGALGSILGRHDISIERFTAAIEIGKSGALPTETLDEANAGLCEVYCEMGDYVAAVTCINAISGDETGADNLARLATEQGDLASMAGRALASGEVDAALANYTKAILVHLAVAEGGRATDAQVAEAAALYCGRARCYAAMGDPEMARDDVGTCLQRSAKHADGHVLRAQLLLDGGDAAAAVAACEAGLAACPGHTALMGMRAKCRGQSGDADKENTSTNAAPVAAPAPDADAIKALNEMMRALGTLPAAN